MVEKQPTEDIFVNDLSDLEGNMTITNEKLSITYTSTLMPRKIPTEKLLEELRRLTDELGRAPFTTEMDSKGKYCYKTYSTRFGSWEEALDQIDETTSPDRKIHSDDKLLGTLRDLAEECGRTPTAVYLSENTPLHYTTYQNRFGSWNKALKKAGLEINRVYKGRIEVECDTCGSEVIRFPNEVKENSHFFCDEECMGEWESENYRGEGNPRYAGGYDGYYGPTWPEQRQKALDRDGEQCVCCGLTNEESKETAERELSVHHRVPKRKFKSLEAAHTLSNLVTLCDHCHMRWEALPVQPETPQLRASD